jgi:tRNA(Ile2) C34 agmatinyltransferase TiaS
MTEAETTSLATVTVEAVEAAEVEEVETEQKPPCGECGVELCWRDAAYVPAGEGDLCKRCYQRAERKQLQGEFTPFTVPVLHGRKMVYVARPGNRAMRRQQGAAK